MKKNSGFMIIEILIAIVIFLMVLLSIFSMVRMSQVRATKADFSGDMIILTQNGVEIASDNLKSDWTFASGNYHPVFDSDLNRWLLVSGSETNIETRFTRKIAISEVCRKGAEGEISTALPCDGVVDENSKLVTVEVDWMNKSFGNPVTARLLVLKTE